MGVSTGSTVVRPKHRSDIGESILVPTSAHNSASDPQRCCAYVVQGPGRDDGSDYLP